MELREIKTEDRELFLKYSDNSGITSQYVGFANLYLWRIVENIRYFIHNDKLFVTGIEIHTGCRYFMFPKASVVKKEDICFLIENFNEKFSIQGLSEADVSYLEGECGELLEFSHMRDMDNYIYLSEDLINLSGKKYHSKKNHINSFKKKYEYEFGIYNSENRKEIMDFLGKWYISKENEDSLIYEANSIVYAIDNFEKLNLVGAYIRVCGKIAAFTLGEKMTDNMAVIHFEKADTDYQGSYAVINNEFVKNCFSDVLYINREEDMGIEGLRKSKLSYKPYMLFKIYSASVKREK